jgi:hypothetical protein
MSCIYGHLVFLRPFGVFYDRLAYFVVTWYIFSHFDRLSQEKSGNSDIDTILFDRGASATYTSTYMCILEMVYALHHGAVGWEMIGNKHFYAPLLSKNCKT